jgi:hypothetical protein
MTSLAEEPTVEDDEEFDDLPETSLDDEEYDRYVADEFDRSGRLRDGPPVGLILLILTVAVLLVAALLLR